MGEFQRGAAMCGGRNTRFKLLLQMALCPAGNVHFWIEDSCFMFCKAMDTLSRSFLCDWECFGYSHTSADPKPSTKHKRDILQLWLHFLDTSSWQSHFGRIPLPIQCHWTARYLGHRVPDLRGVIFLDHLWIWWIYVVSNGYNVPTALCIQSVGHSVSGRTL